MKFIVFFIITFSSVWSENLDELIYSPQYANVYFQSSLTSRPSAELKSQDRETVATKEEASLTSEIEDVSIEQTDNATESTVKPAIDVEIVTEPETEQIQLKPERLTDASELSNANERGVYYIYHPNGLLQKVVYATKDDQENMEYFAQLNYENVEPIREPIYTYDPSTFVLQRLQIET